MTDMIAGEPTLILGPFPPPVHGFSVATRTMAEEIEAQGPVRRFNLASRSRHPGLAKAFNALRALGGAARILAFGLGGRGRISLGCNGGSGLILTLLMLRACRLTSRPVTLHHHSYAYINDSSSWMAAIAALSGRQVTHVFLSAGMARDFVSRYGAVQTAVLPNAYMVPPDPAPGPGTVLRIGLLSNLTAAKGLHRFVELTRSLRAAGVEVSARLAGPVTNPADRAYLDRALAELPELSHAGPVYGADKTAFLGGLDLFVFPTDYRNEAQPIVIYEAMARGVPCLSIDRGCIADQVQDCLQVFPDAAAFDAGAAALLGRLAGPDRARLEAGRARALQRLAEDTALGRQTITALFGHGHDTERGPDGAR